MRGEEEAPTLTTRDARSDDKPAIVPEMRDGVGWCWTACPRWGRCPLLDEDEPEELCMPWLRQLVAERDALEDECRHFSCAYCGERWPISDEGAEVLANHIATCEKHPMRESEKALAVSRADGDELADLVKLARKERDEARAEVERLRAALERRGPGGGPAGGE